ncbi:hypothetical protein SAMN03159489_05986 [Pseudomonas sp. NFPP07]|uniref:hypothetical protein n=1 Tax=Pseudomonas sp. NFPP07 TaxID=1566213 RepID=UPI0008DECA1F|nr:hypothetical protein [Pseudomonas sp. NFPP07]SFQ82580.1 hypothetical protein SAMN03159489_05986 [Pseudomonas sp. NFPP07]
MTEHAEDLIIAVRASEAPPREPICKDCDEDCEEIQDHLGCWLYDMGQGRCLYVTGDKP